MRCAHCKEKDVDIAHVRECSGVPEPTCKGMGGATDRTKNYYMRLQGERVLPNFWVKQTRADLDLMTWSDVSAGIDILKGFVRKGPDSPPLDVPAGRYALKLPAAWWGDNLIWKFFQVNDGKTNWKEHKFVVRLIGAPGDYQKLTLRRDEQEAMLRKIDQAGTRNAMLAYGLHSGVCGKCSSPLSDPTSLARGIGPKCAAKMGW